MSFDQNKAFEVENGVIVTGGAGVFSGSASPVGFDAPLGSIYLRTDGSRWEKTGATTADWHLLPHTIRNVVTVQKSAPAGHFSSIKAANDSITDASSLNPYTIEVGPGLYIEPQIVMKPYVSIVANVGLSTIVAAADPTNHLFIGAQNCVLKGFSITGVTTAGKAAVYTEIGMILDHVYFLGSNIHVWAHAVSDDVSMFIQNCYFDGVFDKAIRLTNVSPANERCLAVVDDCLVIAGTSPSPPTAVVSLSGVNTQAITSSLVASVSGAGGGTCFHVADGGLLRTTDGQILNFHTALYVENTGAAPTVKVSSAIFESLTADINVAHTGTVGSFTGSARRGRITNAAPQTFVLAYTDPDNANFNNSGMLITRGLSPELQTITTAGQTVLLTRFDPHTTVFTGSTAGTVLKLPDATLFTKTGHLYDVWNLSSVDVVIKDFANTTLATLRPNGRTQILLRDITTQAGVWGLTYSIDGGNVFGAQLFYSEANAETSNNSTTTWANKITLVTPSLPAGDYIVQYQFNWRSQNADRQLEFRLQLGGVDIDTGKPFTGSAQDRQLISGFRQELAISGVQTLTLDFRVGGSGTTVYMYNARMFIWRVA